jgi:hypothetical protein
MYCFRVLILTPGAAALPHRLSDALRGSAARESCQVPTAERAALHADPCPRRADCDAAAKVEQRRFGSLKGWPQPRALARLGAAALLRGERATKAQSALFSSSSEQSLREGASVTDS